MEWSTEFHGIAMRCPKRFVQVKNDEVLKQFLDQMDLLQYPIKVYPFPLHL